MAMWQPRPITCALIYLLILVGLTVLSGCQPKGGRGDIVARPLDGSYWKPEPASIRIYPATRLVARQGKHLLMARIEIRDQLGDTLKRSGSFRFELYKLSKANNQVKKQKHYQWQVVLQTLDQQEQYYDDILRLYLFPLELNKAWPKEQIAQLNVIYTSPQGVRFEASRQILTR